MAGHSTTQRERTIYRLVGIFTALSLAQALVSSVIDFSRMSPASAGTFGERATWFGVTELGPLAFLLASSGPGDDMFWLGFTVATGSVAATVMAVVKSHLAALRALGYLAVLLWPLWGWPIAALRIT